MMMQLGVSVLLIAHGVAHLVGFAVPWKLISSSEVPYRTTVLAGAFDVGASGVRVLGVFWLVAAVAFVLLGSAALAGWNVRYALLVTIGMSLILCALGWPDARIGVVVNLALLLALRAS